MERGDHSFFHFALHDISSLNLGLFTVHIVMIYVIQVCWQLASRIRMELSSILIQWKTPDEGQRNCPKHVEFYSKNNFQKLVRLVGFIIRIYLDARSPERQIRDKCSIYIYPVLSIKIRVITGVDDDSINTYGSVEHLKCEMFFNCGCQELDIWYPCWTKYKYDGRDTLVMAKACWGCHCLHVWFSLVTISKWSLVISVKNEEKCVNKEQILITVSHKTSSY